MTVLYRMKHFDNKFIKCSILLNILLNITIQIHEYLRQFHTSLESIGSRTTTTIKSHASDAVFQGNSGCRIYTNFVTIISTGDNFTRKCKAVQGVVPRYKARRYTRNYPTGETTRWKILPDGRYYLGEDITPAEDIARWKSPGVKTIIIAI